MASSFAPARCNLACVYATGGYVAAAWKRLRGGSASGFSFCNVSVMRLTERRYEEAALAFDQAAAAQPSLTIARQRSVQARQAARAAEQE